MRLETCPLPFVRTYSIILQQLGDALDPSLQRVTTERPLYRKLADSLSEAIRSGQYAVGSYLPTEKELCELYDASRHTVREALRRLRETGMVRRRQGSGTLVVANRPRLKYTQYVSSIDDLMRYGAETRFEVLRSERVLADDRLAQLLDCEVGQECVHLHGIRYQRDYTRPVCTTEVYRLVRDDDTHRRLEADFKATVFVLRDELDIGHIGRVEQAIDAVIVDDDQAKELGAENPKAALRTVRRYFDLNNQMLLAAVSVHLGEVFRYSNVLHRDENL